MMKIDDARRLALALFEAGITPWIAETGDGYIVRMILQGEMINVFFVDCESVGNN